MRKLVRRVANMQVNQGAFDVLVAHELLHRDDVDTILQKVCSLASGEMTQHMGVHLL